MTETLIPKITPPAWMVMFLAVLLWELAMVGFGYDSSPGTDDPNIFSVFCMTFMIFGSLFYLPLILVWMMAVVGVFRLCKWSRGHLRAGVMLLPVITIAVWAAWAVATSPPSPFRFFLSLMEEKLPDDAHDFQISSNWMGDTGTYYYFRTNEADVLGLAKRLRLVEVNSSDWKEADKPDFLIYPVNIFLRRSPDPLTWPGRRQFCRRDPSGNGVLMIANHSMTEVFVIRDPMYDRPDEDYVAPRRE